MEQLGGDELGHSPGARPVSVEFSTSNSRRGHSDDGSKLLVASVYLKQVLQRRTGAQLPRTTRCPEVLHGPSEQRLSLFLVLFFAVLGVLLEKGHVVLVVVVVVVVAVAVFLQKARHISSAGGVSLSAGVPDRGVGLGGRQGIPPEGGERRACGTRA